MSDLYRDIIIDHYRRPRNFGTLNKPDASHEEMNALCGDKIRFDVRLTTVKKGAAIADVKFSGTGCAISMASASMLSELIKGKPSSVLQKMGKDDIVNLLRIDLTPTRLKCALLPLEVVQKAIEKNVKKAG